MVRLLVVPTRVPSALADVVSRVLPGVESAWAQLPSAREVLSDFGSRIGSASNAPPSVDAPTPLGDESASSAAPPTSSAAPAVRVASDGSPVRQLPSNP